MVAVATWWMRWTNEGATGARGHGVNAGWRRVPLKHLVGINERALAETVPADTEIRYVDISACGRGALVAEPQPMLFGDAPSRARRLVNVGDVIVSTVRTYLRAVWPVTGPTGDIVVSTGFAVLSPRSGIDPKFLGWLAQSDLVIDEIVARSVGVSYPAINGLEVGEVHVPLPALATQRAIADHLDAETAGIDAIVDRRVRQRRLTDAWEFSLLSEVLVPAGVPTTRLGFMATIQSGLTVDAQRDAGTDAVARPYLRVANVHSDSLALDSVTEITVPRVLAERCTLRFGDVLMTEGGDLDKLGRGTMWRDELPGALHQNHVFAVRPDPRRLNAEYLALLTRTSHARSYFERTGTKTTNLASTNSEKILSLPVPALGIDAQGALVREVVKRMERMSALRSRIALQIDLLTERRQALITAAVTGQLDIPGVAA